MKLFRRLCAWTPVVLSLAVLSLAPAAKAQDAPQLQIARAVHPWEFLSAVGTKAGIFGNESGSVEAWVYPVKILRDFHLEFDVDGRRLSAETLARSVIVKPESTTIVYTGDTFTVRETFFVPIQHSGAVIVLEIESAAPLGVRAALERDFQLEWPAALGATYSNWDTKLHAFSFGEEKKQYAALVGSPSAINPQAEYETNYSSSEQSSFDLGSTNKKSETRVIVIAASGRGAADAEATYQLLSSRYVQLMSEASAYYQSYLQRTVSLELPDHKLQEAYDWSRVSILQGLVNNSALGTGLIAGYRTSGTGARPGFAWFFGRDSLWTELALNAEGDFATTRTALEFLSQFQREDGKIPHEIAQTANLVDWFKNYPYGFASADATPLYLIAMNDYVTASGDVAFAQRKWDSLWHAYQFLKSTYDADGLPRNFGVGHGWVEGGPLLPVESEFYQSALATQALRALSELARRAGKPDVSTQLEAEFSQHQEALTKLFWLSENNRYAFAIATDGKPVDQPTVLATVPMWFGLLPEDKSQAMIGELAHAEHQADWGMRIISSASPLYSGGGYHYGAIWPLFTGWASVGEYRYHRALPAYANLRANALLALDGSPGHVTEVLSGDYYQGLSTSSPHQIWSAAMVVSPMLHGLLGLQVDASAHQLTFAPHAPADWKQFAVKNVHIGDCVVDLRYQKTDSGISLDMTGSGAADCSLEFSPAVSPLAEITSARLDGRAVAFHLVKSATDQHVRVKIAVPNGKTQLSIALRDDFGFTYPMELPTLGTASRGIRVVSENWSALQDRLDLQLQGVAGSTYELLLFNATRVSRVEGAALLRDGALHGIRITMPRAAGGGYMSQKISLYFSKH